LPLLVGGAWRLDGGMVMRWRYEVIAQFAKRTRRFEVHARDEREAFERVSHAWRDEGDPVSVMFVRVALAPRGAW
jgi:hypothetical protein